MPKSYQPADSETMAMLDAVIAEHHPDIQEAHVSIAVLFVFAPRGDDDEPKGAALTLHGRPCDATIKITPIDLRALGVADAIMRIDGDRWERKSEDQQRALLDHEVTHLQVTIGEDEARTVKSDVCDRPVLSMRQHDFFAEGFTDVMRRHGRMAPEVEIIEAFTSTMEQADLPLPGVDVNSAPKTRRKRGGPGKTADAIRAAAEAAEDLVEEIADAAVEAMPPIGRRPPSRELLDVVQGGVS